MNVYIKSVGAYTPEKRVSNEELSKTMDTSDEWIKSHTGIEARHVAAEGVTAADMAAEAAKVALERAGLTAEDLDMIILTTASPDFIGFPSTSCIVQDKIGAKNAGAFDMVAGCTGFIYAVDNAKKYDNSRHSKKCTCSRIGSSYKNIKYAGQGHRSIIR